MRSFAPGRRNVPVPSFFSEGHLDPVSSTLCNVANLPQRSLLLACRPAPCDVSLVRSTNSLPRTCPCRLHGLSLAWYVEFEQKTSLEATTAVGTFFWSSRSLYMVPLGTCMHGRSSDPLSHRRAPPLGPRTLPTAISFRYNTARPFLSALSSLDHTHLSLCCFYSGVCVDG